jgi:hypothetical protein
MWSYASNPNTMSEIVVFLRVQITTEKLASYLVRVSKWHPNLFSLEAINAPIKKRHPHHHWNHVVSTSTAATALSSAKVIMSHSNTAPPRHAPELRYHADLAASAISSSTAANTNTRPGTSSHLRPPHKAKTEARQLAPLPLNWWRFAQHILSLCRPRITI